MPHLDKPKDLNQKIKDVDAEYPIGDETVKDTSGSKQLPTDGKAIKATAN